MWRWIGTALLAAGCVVARPAAQRTSDLAPEIQAVLRGITVADKSQLAVSEENGHCLPK